MDDIQVSYYPPITPSLPRHNRNSLQKLPGSATMHDGITLKQKARPVKFDRIPFNRPNITERERAAIEKALRIGKLSGGGAFNIACEKILDEMLGGNSRTLLVTSCTSALEMAAMLLDIQPGDEVIMPSFTFVSTANAFVLRGARPVFVDIEPETLNIVPELVEAAITPRTKAIVPVHYAGFSCDMDKLMAIADKAGIPVIEDAAQAITATYKGKPLGTIGAMGTFSFHDTKNITCGEGGALIINDPALVERAEIIREKGTNRAAFFQGKTDKYTWVGSGSSYVVSEMQAACLSAQLERVDEIQARRLDAYNTYIEELTPLANQGLIRLPAKPEWNEPNAHVCYFLADTPNERRELLRHLDQLKIGAVFHYVPLHSSPEGQKLGYSANDLPVTEDLASRIVRLPMFAELTRPMVRYICDQISDFLNQRKTRVS